MEYRRAAFWAWLIGWNMLPSFCSSLQAAAASASAAPLAPLSPAPHPLPPPRLAFLVVATTGESQFLKRMLERIWSPHHLYGVHLDGNMPADERNR
jgi:hypothetical protein